MMAGFFCLVVDDGIIQLAGKTKRRMRFLKEDTFEHSEFQMFAASR